MAGSGRRAAPGQFVVGDMPLLHVADQVFDAMLAGWANQRAARKPAPRSEFTAELRGDSRELASIRAYQGALRLFCDYAADRPTGGPRCASGCSAPIRCRCAGCGTPPYTHRRLPDQTQPPTSAVRGWPHWSSAGVTPGRDSVSQPHRDGADTVGPSEVDIAKRRRSSQGKALRGILVPVTRGQHRCRPSVSSCSSRFGVDGPSRRPRGAQPTAPGVVLTFPGR